MEEYRKYNQKNNKVQNNSTYSNRSIEYYKTVEKRTISNVSKVNNSISSSRYQQYSSMTRKDNSNNQNNKTERGNSYTSNTRYLNNSFSNKQKYSYTGTVNEKNKYTYYVSGQGYKNKNEENKNDKKSIKINQLPQRPHQYQIPRPTQIKIQQKRVTEADRKELVDNYQYHETKNLKKDGEKNLVSHRRLCEPFYSVVHSRYSKKYSSYTEQPKTINKSFQRPEYEIIEQKKPIKHIENNSFNYRVEKFSNNNKYKYIPNVNENQNSRNINKINDNRRQNSYNRIETSEKITRITNNYINRREENEKRNNTYLNNRRDVSEKRKSNYMSNRNDTSGDKGRSYIISQNVQQNKNNRKNNYEVRNNRNENQNYNNIYKHEIKVSSRDKEIKNNYSKSSYSNSNSNNPERKRYIPKIENNQNTRPNYNININTNRRNRNINEPKNEQRNQRNQRIQSINNSSKTQYTVEVFEHKRNYYPLEAVKQVEQNYEMNRGENIPQQIEQIAIYERERLKQNIPSDIQIEMRQRSQNVPQQVQEIEVHDIKGIKENIPQFVQQIEVHEINNEEFDQKQNMETNEEMIQNNEEENIEQNYEQQEEVKQEQEQEQEEQGEEQEIYQENNENIETENKQIVEHEEKNIETEQINQQNTEKVEQTELTERNQILLNNENILQSGEKEGDLQVEEIEGNDNQDEMLQVQPMDYDQYIPEQNMGQYISQENNMRNEEIYQINQGQYANMNRFNNMQNYVDVNTHYCPIHGIYRTPYNQNIIFNMNGQYHSNNINKYNLNAEIGEDGMVGDTNNYKFYESKNLKSNSEINSMTYHHLRGVEKFSGNNNTDTNIYVATKVIPIITDSNFHEYQNEYEVNNNIENGQLHIGQEICPTHGKKIVQTQK